MKDQSSRDTKRNSSKSKQHSQQKSRRRQRGEPGEGGTSRDRPAVRVLASLAAPGRTR